MGLSLETRRVRDVSVVTCAGRIAEGSDCRALQQHLDEVLPREARVILNLEGVNAVDSSGLGLLVRWLSRTHTLGGSLKLCAVPPKIRDVLGMTRLAPLFDTFDTEDEALAAFRRPAASPLAAGIGRDVLCVDRSANVLAFLGEALRQAGYRVTTTNNLPDALMLLQAASPKVVIVGAALRATRDTRTADSFNRLLDERPFIELPETFSSDDPGAAGADVFEQVKRLMADAPVSGM
jgi:anti-sigma B factor antagonist